MGGGHWGGGVLKGGGGGVCKQIKVATEEGGGGGQYRVMTLPGADPGFLFLFWWTPIFLLVDPKL